MHAHVRAKSTGRGGEFSCVCMCVCARPQCSPHCPLPRISLWRCVANSLSQIRSLQWEPVFSHLFPAGMAMRHFGACFAAGRVAVAAQLLDSAVPQCVPRRAVPRVVTRLVFLFDYMERERILFCDLALHQFGYDVASQRLRIVDFDSLRLLQLHRSGALRYRVACNASTATAQCSLGHQVVDVDGTRIGHCWERAERVQEDWQCDVAVGHCHGLDVVSQRVIAYQRVLGPILDMIGGSEAAVRSPDGGVAWNATARRFADGLTAPQRTARWSWPRVHHEWQRAVASAASLFE